MVPDRSGRSPFWRGGLASGCAVLALAVLSGCSASDLEGIKSSVSELAGIFDPAPDRAKKTSPGDAGKAKAKSATRLPGGQTRTIARAAPEPSLRPAIGHPYLPGEPSPNKNDPSKLVGMDESGVVRLLGQPQKVRSKPPGTIWSYNANGCSLDVFFYLDIASERFRVLAYEVISTQGSQETKKVCLGRIQSAFRTD